MNSDNIIIATALAFILATFAFRGTIANEFRVFNDVGNALEQSSLNFYFYPLSEHDRQASLTNHLEKVREVQKQLSQTIFTKHLVDLNDVIAEQEKQLTEFTLASELEEGVLSFITPNANLVIADPHFTADALLQCGCLIDETFPDRRSGDAIYAIDADEESIVINIIEQSELAKKIAYKKFVKRVSKEVFEGDSVVLYVTASNPETEWVFKSPDK